MNVEPTIEVIAAMADTLRRNADELERTAKLLRDRQDFSYASDVVNQMTNMFNNLRLELLVTRPLREYQREQASRTNP